MDNLLKAHRPLFEELYAWYSDHHKKPGDVNPFMMADEFKWIFLESNLEHWEFSEWTAACLLNMSM